MKKIIISKPDIITLKSKGYSLIDMHVHTSASKDCSISLDSILKKAKKMGIGVAITDHNKIDSAIAALKNRLGVLVIPGIEVYAKNDKHVLFYFYEKKELIRFYNNEIKNRSISKTINKLINLKDKYKCVVGIAHPRGYRVWHRFKIDPNIKKADCLEVLNSTCSKGKALKSYKWASKYKKGITGGSDMHELINLGKSLTCSKGKTIKEILNSIKERKTIVRGSSVSFGEIVKKLPKDTYHFGLWILAKVYYSKIISSIKNT